MKHKEIQSVEEIKKQYKPIYNVNKRHRENYHRLTNLLCGSRSMWEAWIFL